MKILLVCDQFHSANNGMTISARRFAAVLRQHGNEVRVIGYGMPYEVEDLDENYLLRKQYIPFFDWLVTAQGMTFAKFDRRIATEAVEWCEVIHLLTPFALSHGVIKIARKLGKPYTAAFHVQPENVSSSIHLGKVRWVNDMIYKWFNRYIYRWCGHIHCPSRFIAGELEKHGYTGKLHVISNGIDPDFVYRRIAKTPEYGDKILILMIGRMSIEKRQDVLIDAVAKSAYREKIHLILAGKGPRKKKLTHRGKARGIDMEIRFFTKDELLDIIAMSDLYVHAADMEIEAMSCMEAFACGLVPVIADSPKSATPQFALDARSLFKAGDSDDLAKKADWWLEHPEEREKFGKLYSEEGKKYALDACVRQAEEMFAEAVAESEVKKGAPR